MAWSYAIKGAIWYQGESNAGRAFQYRKLFPAMITDWRKSWEQGDFPFFFVQLANYRQPVAKPEESTWAELREAQNMALQLPKTGVAVIIDIGEAEDIHPTNKQDVGYRLALAARKIAYAQDLVYSGPMYKSMQIEEDKIRIKFSYTGSGLTVKDPYGYLKGFSISGDDHKFIWAKAYQDGNDVIVYSDKIKKPVAVRYGWADNPHDVNLYNKEGLPASPFRTDDWPGITE
jgi:sialate O-acetylesterase